MANTLPGRSYAYMIGLLNQNVSVIQPTPLTSFTMIPIFWEETLFNNIGQAESGSAVGFGQTEPAEFWRFDAASSTGDFAKQKGYAIEGLPKRNGRKLLGTLNDYQAVRAACAFVRDLFERGKTSKRSILNAYAGVGFIGDQPARLAKPGAREAIVQQFLDCELALLKARSIDDVMSALQIARPFNQVAEFRKILFP